MGVGNLVVSHGPGIYETFSVRNEIPLEWIMLLWTYHIQLFRWLSACTTVFAFAHLQCSFAYKISMSVSRVVVFNTDVRQTNPTHKSSIGYDDVDELDYIGGF